MISILVRPYTMLLLRLPELTTDHLLDEASLSLSRVEIQSSHRQASKTMLKRGVSKTAVVFLVLMVFFFASHVNLSLLSRSNVSVASSISKTRPGIVNKTREDRPARSPPHSLSEIKRAITCDCSHKDYDLWFINGPTLLDPITLTFFTTSPINSIPPDFAVKFHPYPRKTDERAKSKVNQLTLTSAPSKSSCEITHSSPAIVFSTGGYTGNFYHQFNDVLLALYITINSLSLNRDVILTVINWSDWWVQKYGDLLHHFTKHPILNMDNQTRTHCFPSAITGLMTHGPLVVDPTLTQHKSLLAFHALLEKTYIPRGKHVSTFDKSKGARPQLVLVNRKNGVGREILNLKEALKAIEEVGFKVIVFEPKRNGAVGDTYRLLHGSHAMLAVHGAAMTHLLFLRVGMVLGEIVPIGTDWLANTFYEKPARVLGLEYMKYKIAVNESSLAEKYGADDLVLNNPPAFVNGNWTKAKVYMKTQNVKLDMVRFRKYLKEVFVKAKRFMDKEG